MREVTATQVADVLDAAVDLYESGTYGWVQGKYVYSPPGETPRRCMLAILDTATYETVRKNTVTYNRVRPEVVDAISAEIGSIPSWNDTPGRTVDEVVELMKSIAKDLRNTQ
jgi:hypothetical protein